MQKDDQTVVTEITDTQWCEWCEWFVTYPHTSIECERERNAALAAYQEFVDRNSTQR